MALTTKDAVRLLETRFGIAPDCPFLETDAMVFRHPASRRSSQTSAVNPSGFPETAR